MKILAAVGEKLARARFLRRYGEQSEFQIFISRNRVYLFLAFICVFLCIKHSPAPFLWKYTAFTKLLFLAPQENTIFGSFFEILYNLGLAYLASLLFFLIVDYFPKRKKERKAYVLIQDHIETIDLLVNRLISYMMFFAGMEGDSRKLTPENLPSLCGIPLTNEEVPCHTTDYYLKTNEVCMESNPGYIKGLGSLRDVSSAILDEIRIIFELPYANDIDHELLELLGQLQKNAMLSRLSEMKDSYARPGLLFTCNYTPQDIVGVCVVLAFLGHFPYRRHYYVTTKVDPEDIENARREYEEFLRKHPESVQLLEALKQAEKEGARDGISNQS